MTAERRADLAFGIVTAAGLAFIFFLGPLQHRLAEVRANDFAGFWLHGYAVVHGVDPYDVRRWQDLQPELRWLPRAAEITIPGYMPWAALFFAPLALLPLEVAAWLWMAAGIAAAVLGLRGLLRAFVPGRPAVHAAFGAALFFGQPSEIAVALGQWSPLLLGAVAVIVLALRSGRPRVAALPVPLLLMKPHLFVFTGIGLLFGATRSRTIRRALPLALALAAATIAIGWLAFPDWLASWSAEVQQVRPMRSAVMMSGFSQLLGPTGVALSFALLVAAALLVARLPAGSDRSLAAWLALSSVATIYSWSYDYLLLLAPLVMTAGIVASRGDERGARLLGLATALAAILVAPLLNVRGGPGQDETLSAVLPVAAFVAVLLLVRKRAAAPARVAAA